MSILDDLESQPEQENKPAGEQPPASAGADEFYRAHVKQRMIMAYDFFTQLVNKLIEKKPVIKAEYPFKPEGKKVTLLQQGYKAYSDDITDPRQITLSFSCILANPSTYDVRGRGPALAQGELLERYEFKYEKQEARDQNQMVIGARFKLQGPLQVKCVLQFDEAKQIIKLLLTNIIGPGTSQYNLKPEQLDATFMDRLGKYLLRKEAKLFQEEISDEAKAMLRKKLQQEQLQRESELRVVEEQRKAEEAARKQNSTTQQLKNAVSQSVAENREKLKKVMEGQVREKGEKLKKVMEEQVKEKGEKLKSMFNKLKNRAGIETASEQTSASPAVNTSQSARPSGNPAGQGLPPVNQQAGQAVSARQNATRPKSPADQKKPTPPKVFQASASNPFLKPEDFEPVPKGGEVQTEVNADMKNPAAQLPAETATPATAKTPTPTTPPAAAQAKPAAESNAPAAKTAAVLAETIKSTAQSPAQTTTPATQTPTTPPAAEAKPVAAPSASAEKTANPSRQTKPPEAPTEPELLLELIAPDAESSPPTAPAEPELSLAQIASDAESSPLAVPAEPESSLDPIASDAESSPLAVPAEPELSLELIVPDAESSPPTAPAEPELTLDPVLSGSEPSPPAELAEPELSLKPNASGTEHSSPAAPAELELTLAPVLSDAESSSSAAPAEPELTLDPNMSGSESSSLTTKTKEPQPELSSDPSALSLEDEFERDLLRIMENDQQQPSLEGETSDAPSLTSGELDFDLSSPDALEIHFEDEDKASDQDNSELKK